MAKIEIFRVAALVFRTVNFVSTISSAVYVHVTQVWQPINTAYAWE